MPSVLLSQSEHAHGPGKIAISRTIRLRSAGERFRLKTPKLHVGDTGLACSLAGVEIKAAATVTAADFRGLRKLQTAAGERFSCGIVLYDGETSASFGDRMYAVPVRTLWDGPT